MEQNSSKVLTQDALVRELHMLGYNDVTKRRIASLRANDLLPAFDIVGRGLGKRRGRESNAWSNGELVLSQAAQVCELLKIYGSYDDLHLPLWMLGYPVPLERVRGALRRPLDQASREVEVEIDGRSATEDVIDEEMYKFTEAVQRTNMKLFDVPKEILEAFANLFLNSNYNLVDAPFEDGLEALERLDQTIQQKCEKIFGDEVAEKASLRKPDDAIWTAFTHAPFINKYLSLRPLKEAVDECTDEDLMVVQRDLRVGREMVFQVKQFLMSLIPYIPSGPNSLSKEDLITVFSAGKLCIWADLSLRRNGYAKLIDEYVSLIWSGIQIWAGEIQKQFKEELKQESAGTQITLVLETIFQELGIPLGGQESLSSYGGV
jgi:hypothetical protein